MVLELVHLTVIPDKTNEFESAFQEAKKIISRVNGFISYELLKHHLEINQYVLLIKWESIHHHKEGFRKSNQYQKWKELLHLFYSPFPKVEYFLPL